MEALFLQKEEIKKYFSLDNTSTHCFRIFCEDYSFIAKIKGYIKGIGLGLFIPLMLFVYYAALSIIGLLFSKIAFWISITFIVFGASTIIFKSRLKQWILRESPGFYSLISNYKLIPISIRGIAVMGLLYFLSSQHSPFNGDFEISTDNKFYWAFYTVENYLNIVLFNGLSVFNIQLSPIKAISWLGKLITQILNFLMVMSFVEGLMFGIKTFIIDETFYGTIEDCYYKCQTVGHLHAIYLLEYRGEIEKPDKLIKMDAFDFASAFSDEMGKKMYR